MPISNNAKMREAIAECVNLITEFGNAEIVKTPLDVIIDIEAILKAALAAPARNCDVGTPREQELRMDEWCHNGNRDSRCEDGRCPIFNRKTNCVFDWLQMPCEEGATDGNK